MSAPVPKINGDLLVVVKIIDRFMTAVVKRKRAGGVCLSLLAGVTKFDHLFLVLASV